MTAAADAQAATSEDMPTTGNRPPLDTLRAQLDESRRILDEDGIPGFRVQPNPNYRRGAPARLPDGYPNPAHPEFYFPAGWDAYLEPGDVPPHYRLDRWEPGDGVLMCTGLGLDGVDIDTKHGAVVEDQRQRLYGNDVNILGRVRTPSGGAHFYVPSSGICSSADAVTGVDYRGRGRDGTGAGLLYMPGTSRPLYDGAGYEWVEPIEPGDGYPRNGAPLVEEHSDTVGSYLWGLGIKPRSHATGKVIETVGATPYDVRLMPPWLRELVADLGPEWEVAGGERSQDRSKRFHHLVKACQRARLAQGQAVTVLAPWCDAVGKYAGRVADEVARSWGKGDDSQEETPTEASEGAPAQGADTPKGSREPSRWIDSRDGLLVADLSQDITAGLPVMRDSGDGLWLYSDGVWGQDGNGRLRAEVVDRLGNRTRNAHTSNVQHYLLGVSAILGCDPLPDTLNVPNGLLDWRSGNLRPHSPDFHGTVQLAAEWDENATCPGVTEWLRQVLPADLLEPTSDGGPGFIWEVLGYLCMSGNPLHKAVLLLGSGRNGKGTFLRMVTELLGVRNVSSVDLHSLVNNRFRVAELFGRVANIAGDLDGQWLESTAVFKAITGGDTVTAERKYGQPFDFRPFAVPVYSANAVWGTPDTTDGYLSRWLVVPFPNSFLGAEDRGLDGRLSKPSELSGVLAQGVRGLRAVMARGNFSVPDSVAQAFDRFADESDPIRGFIRDTTIPDYDGWVTRGAVWETYEVWAKENGTRSPLSRAKLYARLAATGWAERMTNGSRGFIGRTRTVRVVDGMFPGQRHLEPVEGHESTEAFTG